MFNVLELMFNALEHVFAALEHVFTDCEYKILLGGRTNPSREKETDPTENKKAAPRRMLQNVC